MGDEQREREKREKERDGKHRKKDSIIIIDRRKKCRKKESP